MEKEGVLMFGRRAEPELNPDFKFAIYNPGAGCVCPYGLTIAYGENAVENGARISLNTVVSDMEVKEGIIQCVHTNRGRCGKDGSGSFLFHPSQKRDEFHPG